MNPIARHTTTTMLNKHLTRLLKIHPSDVTHLVNLSVLNILLVAVHSFGTSIVTSLFIKRYGVGYLPKMYLISPFVIVLCTLLVLRLSGIKRNTLLIASCTIFGVLVIAGRILLQFDLTVACPALYILGDVVNWTFYTQFWALAVDICDVRQGKRIFTYVVCAGLIGGVLAGSGVNLLVRRFGNNDLLILWALLFFAVVLYLASTASRQSASSGETAEAADDSFLRQLKETAFYFTTSRHVRILTGCVILAAVSANFVDYVFNRIMDGTFADENRLTAFYGTYTLFYYGCTLLVQLFITSRVVSFLGAGKTLLLLPASVTLGLGSLAAAFGYYTGVCTKFCKDVATSSFSDSVYPLMFSPLKENFRNSIIAISEGLLTPLGTAAAGGILMLLAGTSNAAMVTTGIGFALLWIYFGFLLKNSYQTAFISNLAERSLPDISAVEDMANMSETQAVQLLAKALRSDDHKVSYFAMRTLAQSPDTAAGELLARYLEENPPAARKADLLSFLGGLKNGENYLPVIENYLADPDPLVRAKAVGAFLPVDSPRAKERILPFVHDADLRVQLNAVMVLWKFGPQKEYCAIISSATDDPSEETRRWACFTLRKVATKETLPLLLKLSRDRSPRVRLEAIRGLKTFDGNAANARLIEMLHGESRKVRQAAYKALVDQEGLAKLLVENYTACRPELREPLVQVLAARREGEDIVFRYLEDELRAIYKRIVWVETLRREKQMPALELFTATLLNRNRRALDRILRISSNMEGSTAFGLIVKRLKDRDPRSFAEALELLDTMTLHRRSFLKSIIALLEGLPEHELAAYARRDLSIRTCTAEEIYDECLQDLAGGWFRDCVHYLKQESA